MPDEEKKWLYQSGKRAKDPHGHNFTQEEHTQRYNDLYNSIKEAQRRQVDESGKGKLLDAVTSYWAGMNAQPPGTFKSKPFIEVPRAKTAQDRADLAIANAERNLRWYKLRYNEALKPAFRLYNAQTQQYDAPVTEDYINRWRGHIQDAEQRLKDVSAKTAADYEDERFAETGFKKGKGGTETPKKFLTELYQMTRGRGHFDQEGDFITSMPRNMRFNSFGSETRMHKMAKAGLIQYDMRTGVLVIPRATIKKIDPYFKDYHKTLNDLIGTSAQPRDLDFKGRLGQILSLKGLKNVSRSQNPAGALNEISTWIDDHLWNYREHVADDAAHTFDSLNEIRGTREGLQAAEARRERGNMINAYIEEHPEARELSNEQIYNLVYPPFEYTPQIQQVVSASGWELPADTADLVARGKEVHNCVGSPFMNYARKISTNQSLILIKGDVTAEIGLVIDKNDRIAKAVTLQVKLPYNDNASEEDYAEINKIAQSILNMPVKIEEDAEVDAQGQDIEGDLMQHLWEGGFVDNPAEQNEENKLLNEAVGLKGTAGIEEHLEGHAAADGFTSDQIRNIVGTVLQRLDKTERGKHGGAFGVPHKAQDQYKAIKSAVKSCPI
jgi:hypothetical protein